MMEPVNKRKIDFLPQPRRLRERKVESVRLNNDEKYYFLMRLSSSEIEYERVASMIGLFNLIIAT